jgi:predicted DNA-binding ArsR family transcriptional regulator
MRIVQSQDGTAWKRSSKTCMKLTSAELQWKTPDDGQRRCPKYVEFYNRINLDN